MQSNLRLHRLKLGELLMYRRGNPTIRFEFSRFANRKDKKPERIADRSKTATIESGDTITAEGDINHLRSLSKMLSR